MSLVLEDPSELLAGLDQGMSIPAHWYTDPEITAREIELIFRKSWNYLGPAKELQKVGDYITGYAGELPVVVIRNQSGLGAFINVCRHRRHEVMKGRGCANMMQCGYHAWAYDLKGLLKRAPRSAAEPNFRLEDFPLMPVRVETLGPWVFVNPDKSAPPLQSYFGKLLDIIAESGIKLDTLELYSREDWSSDANWKTMLENYLECYHCPVAHPGFSAAIDTIPENYHLTTHGWFLSQVGKVRASALVGKSAVKIYDARGELKQAQYHVLWPNFTININPGFANMSLDVWIPNGPNHTHGFSEQYFGPGVSKEFAEELIGFNKQVGIEDDDLTNSVQRGLIGGLPPRGRFLTNSEHLVVHFQKLVVNSLSKAPAAAKQAVEAQAAAPQTNMITVSDADSLIPQSERNAYFPVEVERIEKESDVITSFYLRRVDGATLAAWEPGQFLPIRLTIPGQPAPVLRTYSLSTCANPHYYRLSIRRIDNGLVSRYLHDSAKTGLRIEAMTPRGKFVLDQISDRPVVMLSGGVGLTPMLAMLEHLNAAGKREGHFRTAYFIHGAENSRVHAFGQRVREIAGEYPNLTVQFCYSAPAGDDKIGLSHHVDGFVSIDLLKKVLPFGDYDFYLCGPPPFMTSLYSGLIGMGVRPERIRFESFGPATVQRPEAPAKPVAAPAAQAGEARVRFSTSGVDAQWSASKGTLLELAEAAGLTPAFGCRSGICGTCKTKLRGGAVEYLEEPLATRGEDEVLLCCSVPRRAPGHQADSHEPDIILEL